jgi:protein gp37
MGAKSNIEWTDSTWNPIRGCSRVSEGCRHCYAEGIAARFSKPGQAYDGLAVMQNHKPHWTGKIDFVEKHLLDPLKWSAFVEHVDGCVFSEFKSARGQMCFCPRKPRRIFVNSMSDLFHENATDEMRDKIFAVMALCPQHIFQVLTKRPDRMLAYVSNARARINELAFVNALRGYGKINLGTLRGAGSLYWPLKQVWLGVSIEDQKAADDRIESLLRTPAAVRFISAEPLLGPINLGWVGCECDDPDSWDGVIDALRGKTWIEEWDDPEGSSRTRVDCNAVPMLDWVICGGESGPGARPMQADWARSLRDQCVAAGVPFFFKQWGEYLPPMTDGGLDRSGAQVLNASDDFVRVGKHAAGSLLDGREWKQFPETRA